MARYDRRGELLIGGQPLSFPPQYPLAPYPEEHFPRLSASALEAGRLELEFLSLAILS
jgi:hypothetical protein